MFKGGAFYLKDMQSSTGTFIKISEHQVISEGMIIEMGSNQYLIEQVQVNSLHQELENSIEVVIHVLEGPDGG